MTEKLDHLVELGVNLLYLTPVFPAASNHRYDASSFLSVDPLLGGDEAYIRLIEAAHERGIRVIGDLTSNHSGDRHEWFLSALGNPAAPAEEFYYFTDEGNTEYVSWLGYPTLPKFNWASEKLRERFIDGPDSVVAKWLKPPYNTDGWRIDVANMTGPAGRGRPERRGAAAAAPDDDRHQPRDGAAGGVDQRRDERSAGRRLARRDDLPVLHPAAVGVAE